MISLANKRILIVEDEVVIAMMLQDMLADMEAVVVGPAYNLKSGLALAEFAEIDGAVLDVNLGNGTSADIADLLASRKIPFMLATGYGQATDNKHKVPVLQKPCLKHDLEFAFSRLFQEQ